MTRTAPSSGQDADLLIVGGGLASGLIALAVAARDPGRRVMIIAPADPADSHTWSFHDTDLSEPAQRWIAPAVAHRWQGQEVRFPGYRRDLDTGYASLTSRSLRDAVAAGATVHARRAVRITADHVQLATGERLTAPCVIDATGVIPRRYLVLGWQKFVGVELDTEQPHGRQRPIIMDATVDQRDGYRFVYTLPFGPQRILIEDTRYADGPRLDESDFDDGIAAYAAAQGWSGTTRRRERGVLPIAMAFDSAAFWRDAAGGAVPVGMRAALFHPVTGYSLPLAALVADLVAATPGDSATVLAAVRELALDMARRQRFLRLLSRMLFKGAAPDARRAVLERFYRLPEPLIERFYAGNLTVADQARILVGKPPIPIRAALPCLREEPMLTALRQERAR
ncbi:lycopene beta-cyclase CrtY [uncultured Paracoccus sp.]|uniref:lycopene beta-cyclase CrtY n=1 Tax=uncultured Paracoccus sp. TaxID=189685 RepID=UPI00260ABBA9|nr:lycopene beta-cyclase CrtY [uncultured Paracoccus sp.]